MVLPEHLRMRKWSYVRVVLLHLVVGMLLEVGDQSLVLGSNVSELDLEGILNHLEVT